MPRFFNTAGPCKPDIHYMLPVARRMPTVRALIDQQAYFVLHAPRQVGKTTTLMALGRELTAEGRFAALLVSMEVGAAFPGDTAAAELAILSAWGRTASWSLPPEFAPPPWPDSPPGGRIAAALHAWTRSIGRPLVIFLDEIDALRDETLLSVLRQIRDGYPGRPTGFPWSLALVGLRDVRDYKIASGGSEQLNTSSPFNIKVESLTMSNFAEAEVAELYSQHTFDTGQRFERKAVERAFAITQGQPWLVNALGRQLVEVLVPGASRAITAADVDAAREILIQRNDTHLDSLTERLREPRMRRVIEPILAGAALGDVPQDDLRFALDLGLVRRTNTGGIEIANPIYKEVIPRALASTARDSLPTIRASWLTVDGKLDAPRLLDAFLAFWRQHGQPLLGTAHYTEIAPHIVLMAFLDRVANGGGTIDREYAIGSGRMDLLLRYGDQRVAMELKVWRDDERDPRGEKLEQLDAYLAGLGLSTGWLVVFDRRSGQPRIAERTSSEAAVTPAGRQVTLIRA